MPKAEGFITITPVNFDELAEKYANSREYIMKAIHTALRSSGKLLTPRIKEATPEGATGKLKRYTIFQILGKSDDMRCEVRQSAFSDGGYPYGQAVRLGTRPHFPPIDALVPWVIKKLGVAEDRARQVAFLVCRKISRVGTKPNPYHIRVYEQSRGEIMDIMKENFVQAMVEIQKVPEVSI